MPIPFYPYDYLRFSDIERCPYTFRQPEYDEWSKKDDERKLLIALDRYADLLQRRTRRWYA